ncbi:MAG: hypothetical protein NC203_05355 [Firmicutes bacterium]|nr:hypothetical protein [[Eubacterium] siraeum]MCM1487778.1 hypothetical protein [Bacillota bacterium]
MTNILLVSNTLDNINVAWRHFANRDYSTNATTNYDSAMINLHSDKKPEVIVYYVSGNTTDFIAFYRLIRSDEIGAKIPVVILADADRQTVLSRYIEWDNACVLGISVSDGKLGDVIRGAVRGNLIKKQPSSRPAPNRAAPNRNTPKRPDYTRPNII